MVRGSTSLVLSVLVVSRCRRALQRAADAAGPDPVPRRRSTRRSRCGGSTRSASTPELVARLETLFRMELDRLDKQPLPTRRDIERVDHRRRSANCTGEEKCLAAIGKKLGVDVVVTGTVGALGDNYVLNIKVVDVATAQAAAAHPERPAARQPRRADRRRARRGVQAARARPAPRRDPDPDRHRRRRGRARRQADRQDAAAEPRRDRASSRSASTSCASRRRATTPFEERRRGPLPEGQPGRRAAAAVERGDRHRQDRARRAQRRSTRARGSSSAVGVARGRRSARVIGYAARQRRLHCYVRTDARSDAGC